MKKSKVMLFGAMALTAGLALAACGSSQSNNADKTYSYIFVNNPDTLDYAAKTLRPLRRRAANTRRPFLVDIRLRNPCLRARRSLLG